MVDASNVAVQQGQGSVDGVQGMDGKSVQNGDAQGANPEYVSKADYEALSKKLDDVIGDNVKYRERLRNAVGDDGTGKTGDTGNEDVSALISELRQERFQNQITAAATKAKALAPDLIYRLLDMSTVADKNGRVTNPDKVMADLKESHPTLFRTRAAGSANGGEGNGSAADSGDNDINALMRRRFRNTTVSD